MRRCSTEIRNSLARASTACTIPAAASPESVSGPAGSVCHRWPRCGRGGVAPTAIDLAARDHIRGSRCGRGAAGKPIGILAGMVLRTARRASEGDEVTFARALTPKAVLYASLPAGAVDIVLRASASPASPPVSVNVQVDGKATSQLKIDGESYRDLLVNVLADSTRPHVSEIMLHVLSVTTDLPAFEA